MVLLRKKKESFQYLLSGLRVELEDIDSDPIQLAAEHLKIDQAAILKASLQRRSIDARRGRPHFVVSLLLRLDHSLDPLPASAKPYVEVTDLPPPVCITGHPEVAIVGTGPAGLFAADRLSQAGVLPVLIERGEDLTKRQQDVSALLDSGRLSPESNLHFGMGGAGTFSDGKLFTRLDHQLARHVLSRFAHVGQGQFTDLLVEANPHVGTDRWPLFLEHFRQELMQRGCKFLFRTRVTGIQSHDKQLSALLVQDGRISCQAAILAPGNSARDLFLSLHKGGVELSAKAFAVGVRLAHPQEIIDRIQYGRHAGHPKLPPASYRIAGTYAGRGVYSFCMCPGGQIIPTPTEEGGLCLNGMSNSRRDSGEANAAIVVSLSSEDMQDPIDPLCGIGFQRSLEASAYAAGGQGFVAPGQALLDFLSDRPSVKLPPCNFRPGIRAADVGALLPPKIIGPMRQALSDFGRKMHGWIAPEAVVLGLETRTSSPVRMVRGPDGMSPSIHGLFPAGEGAGYAGGITSSAVDGIRAADALLAWLQKE